MKVFSIVGVRKSGKTTVVTELVKAFKKRGYRVGTVKTIFCPTFTIDNPSSNTARHKAAGADVVCAKARNEVDIIYSKGLEDNEILPKFDVDILLLEGDYEILVPRIVCAHKEQEVDERRNEYTIAVSGQIGARCSSYGNLPVFNVLTQTEEFADWIVENVAECEFPVHMQETKLAAPGFCHCGCHKAEKKQEANGEEEREEVLSAHPVNIERKHIFLTGQKQVGKSTILTKVLDELKQEVAGYQTRPYQIEGQTKGYYLHSLRPLKQYENDSPVCVRMGERKNYSIAETYEQLGVEILQSLSKNEPLILLDEIGKLEKNAYHFQREVFACLDRSPQVLGVLQKTDSPLVKAISARTDVVVITVTKENREKIPKQILALLEENKKIWRK